MISILAALYWILLAVRGDPTEQSAIKSNYPNIQFIEIARAQFLNSLTGISEDSEGLVAGLTIGVRDLVSEELALNMKNLSLTHLIAVSGANLAIVMGVVYLLTAALGLNRNLRFCLALGVMAIYVLLVGPESSVIRAAVMATFVAIGLWLGRGTAPIHSLALAILLLLTLDPALALDIGFALSALATAGLLILAPLWFERLKLRMPIWLAAGVAATASAQLYTLPVLLILQPSLPVYSVLANLLVEPAVAPVTILGIVAVLCASFVPPLAPLVNFLASLAAQWIVWVAQHLGALPGTRLHFVPGVWGIALVVLATIFATALAVPTLGRIRGFSSAGLVATIAISAGWVVTDWRRFETFAGDWEVLACDVGQGDALLIRSAGKIALVDTGRDQRLLERCLAQAGVSELELLFLSHYDLDHVGAVGALRAIPVRQVYVSGFDDDRPVVELVGKLFKEKNTPLSIGYAGLSGILGEIRWQILAPSHSANEAADSNEGSLVTLFESSRFSVLGLGDLGETGQQRLLRQHPQLSNYQAPKTLVVKVAHHGSKDQLPEFLATIGADIAVFPVGKNDYGHPTRQALNWALAAGAKVLRTDEIGSIAMGATSSGFAIRSGGKLSG